MLGVPSGYGSIVAKAGSYVELYIARAGGFNCAASHRHYGAPSSREGALCQT